MSIKIYVGNLSYTVTNQHLQQQFSQFGGVVSAKIVQDRDSGRSKGFAFVEMVSDAAAQAAIRSLNGQPLDGRMITVNEARPMEERTSRVGGFGGSRSY